MLETKSDPQQSMLTSIKMHDWHGNLLTGLSLPWFGEA